MIHKGFSINWSSAHFYANKNWTEQENQNAFGLCYHPYGHGHDYNLEVLFEDKSGFDPIRAQSVLNKLKVMLDHKHINFDIQHFSNHVPTTENMALFIKDFLSAELGSEARFKICLNEGPHIKVEF